mgnify:CR=1 FL=1
MFGFKTLNEKNKKELLTISLWECNIKGFPKRFLISIDSKNRFGASLGTMNYILELFFKKYVIFAYKMFTKKILYKKGFKNYFFDEEDYNAIFGQDELHNIFHNPGIAERFYFINIEYENLEKSLYEKCKEYVDFIEGNIQRNFLEDIKIMGSEIVWSDLGIFYTSIDDYIKDIKNSLPQLLLYLSKNELLY